MKIIDTVLLQRFFTGLKPKFATAAQGQKADAAVPATRKVNNKALSGDIALTAEDVGALPKSGQAADAAKLAGYDPRWWMPAGVIVPYGGASAPSGWLLCNGAAVSRTTYAGLFAVLGTTYGSGNGSTTFNLPDLRGRVAVGSDANLPGVVAGEKGTTLPQHNVPSMPIIIDNFGSSSFMGAKYGSQGPNGFYPSGGFIDEKRHGTAWATNGTADGKALAHNNIQPSLYLNYVIKV